MPEDLKDIFVFITPVLLAIVGWFVKKIDTKIIELSKASNINAQDIKVIKAAGPYQPKEVCSVHHQNLSIMFTEIKESLSSLEKNFDKWKEKSLKL